MTTKQLTQTAHHPSQPTDRGVQVGLAAASAWSLFLMIMSVLWGLGIVASPLAGDEKWTFTSLVASLTAPAVAGVIGFVALVSFVLAVVPLSVPRLRERLRERSGVRLIGLIALALTAVVTVVFTDTLLLAYLGYTLSFQFPPIPAPVIWQAVLLIGPVLWLVTWAAAERSYRIEGRMSHRSGSGAVPRERRGASSVSTGAKVAVAVAIIVPGFYALTRISWAVGIPLGLSEGLYDEGQRVGMWHSGLALALAAIGGILLTLGLVQKWGERLPAWLGPLGGRRVPIPLATVPATIVSLALFTGGIGLVRTMLGGPPEVFGDSWWATIGPTLFFPVWGIALGWATYAYRERRLAAETEAPAEPRS